MGDRPYPKVTAAFLIVLVLAQVISPIKPVAADQNPATAGLSHSCELIRPTSTGSQLGSPAVAVGEQVQLVSRAHFAPGTLYQDALTRPDGSIEYTSYLELTLEANDGMQLDPAQMELRIDGSPTPLTSGTRPASGRWVLHAISSNLYRAYLPGDVDPADPTQEAQASITVPATGMTAELVAPMTVADTPSNAAGTVVALGECALAVSTGSSNRVERGEAVSVAVAEPELDVSKSASAATVAPGGSLEWTVSVESPEDLDDSLNNGAAHSLVVTDVLPAGLTPIDAGGRPLADGAAVPGAHPGSPEGRWNATARTLVWSIPQLEVGDRLDLRYRTLVDDGLDPDESRQLSNSATATWSSLPDGAGRRYEADPVTASVVVGAPSPTISKTVDRTSGAPGSTNRWTVEFVIPANSVALHDVTFVDFFPDGLSPTGNPDLSCSGCQAGDPMSFGDLRAIDQLTAADGRILAGWSLGTLEPNASARTYTITTTTETTPSGTYRSDGDKMKDGDTLENVAAIGYNLIPRLGAVAPNLRRLPAFDAFDITNESITIGSPKLSIDKVLDADSPIDPDTGTVQYTVTVHNTGPVDAFNVEIWDEYDRGAIWPWWDQPLPAGVTADWWNETRFHVQRVPAGESVSFSYEMHMDQIYASGDPLRADPTDNKATIVGVTNAGGTPYPQSDVDDIEPATAEFVRALPDVDISIAPAEGFDSANRVGAGSDPVTMTVTLKNNGDGTANLNQVKVPLPDGWTHVGATSPGWWWNGSNTEPAFHTWTSQFMAPGAELTIDLEIRPPATTEADAEVTFSATVDYRTRDWRDRYIDPDSGDEHSFTSSANTSATLIEPRVTVSKTPDEGAIVEQSGSFRWTIRVTNPTSITLRNISLVDYLPETLQYASSSFETVPEDTTVQMSNSGEPTRPEIWFDHLAPGTSIFLTIETTQSGVPEDFELVNTVSIGLDGTLDTFTDTGTTTFVADIERPSATKSVTPSTAAPGELVDYTVELTLPTNAIDLYSTAFVDEIPDGIEFLSYGDITCKSGPCTQTPTPMAQSQQPNGAWHIGWFIGDQPGTAAASVWEATYRARVDRTYSGLGSPAAGQLVLDGTGGEPFRNRIRGYANLNAPLATVPTVTPNAPRATWEIAGLTASAPLDVTSPAVKVDKTVTNHETMTWTDVESRSHTDHWANVGERIDYRLKVCNTGSAPAFDIELTDSGGEGNLVGVSVDSMPSGASNPDPWSEVDPEMGFVIDRLDASECAEIEYSGTTLDSDDLTPGFVASGAGSVGVIDNSVILEEYHTIGSGEPGDEVYSPDSATEVRTLVIAPVPETWSSCAAGVAGERIDLEVSANNAAGDIGPDWMVAPEGSSPLVDPVLVVELPQGVTFVPGSVTASGPYTGSDANVSFPNPTVSDGARKLTWQLDDLPMHRDGNLMLRFKAELTEDVGYLPLRSTLSGADLTGSLDRGTSTNHPFTYSYTSAWCPGDTGASIQKWPKPNHSTSIVRRPGDTARWWGSWNAGATIDPDDVNPSIAAGATITDTMPDGVTYVPGTATFEVTRAGDTTETLTAGVEIAETVLDNADGTQTITWRGFGEHDRVSYSVPVTIDTGRPDLVDTIATNLISIDLADDDSEHCGVGADMCDSAMFHIVDPVEPLVSSTIDDEGPAPWGEPRRITTEILLPAGERWEEAVVIAGNGVLEGLPTTSIVAVSALCTAGCGDPGDASWIAPVFFPLNNRGFFGWYLGDIEAHTEARTVTLVYDVITFDGDELAVNSDLAERDSIPNLPEGSMFPLELDAHFYSTVASPAPPPIGLPDGINNISNWENNYCRNMGGCLELANDSVNAVFGHPWLELDTVCQGANPAGETMGSVPLLSGTEPGVPNVICRTTVTNRGSAPAYGITVTDEMDPSTGDWEVLSTSGSEFAPSTSWAGSGDRYVQWTSDPTDPLEAGESWTFRTISRVVPGEATRDMLTVLERSAQLGPYSAVRDAPQRPYPGRTMPSILAAIRPFSVGYVMPWSQSTADETGDLDLAARLTRMFGDRIEDGGGGDSDPFEVMFSLPFDQDNASFATGALTMGRNSVSTLNLTDQLPAGWRYTSGTARLAALVDPDGDPSSGDESIRMVPINDPAVTSSAWPGCDPLGGFGDDLNAGGDSLTWVFSRNAASPMNAVWDPALNQVTAEILDQFDVEGSISTPISHIQVVFDATVDEAARRCSDAPQVLSGWRSTATSTPVPRDGGLLMFEFGPYDWTTPLLNLVTLTKSPDGGLVPDGTTAAFHLDIENWGPQGENPGDPWSFDEDRFSMSTTVVDTFTDRGLVDPATFDASLTQFAPESTGLGSERLVEGEDYTETVVRLDPDTIQITWEISHLRAGVEGSPQDDNPLGLDPARLRITLPFEVPLDTPDGTRYDNTATLQTGPLDIGAGWGPTFNLTDTADLTVVNPSPPPTPVKSGPEVAAIGERVDYEVSFTLPAGRVWLDLYALDTLPTGLRFESVKSVRCTTATGARCWDLPEVSHSDGRLLMWFGDYQGADQDRTVTVAYAARVVEGPQQLRAGDALTNQVVAYSNDTNRLGTGPDDRLVAGDAAPPDHGPTRDASTLTVGSPQVRVDKVVLTPGPLTAGSTATWQVTITNDGDTTAYDLDIEDRPSVGVQSLMNDSITGPMSASKGWTRDDPTLGWFIDRLEPGETATVTYSGTVVADYPALHIAALDNRVRVYPYGSQPESNPDRDVLPEVTDRASIPLQGPRVNLDKEVGPCGSGLDTQLVVRGEQVPWCITVRNDGEETATDALVVDTLPVGWTFDRDTINPAATVVTGPTGAERASWDLGDLDPGDEVEITYSATPGSDAGRTGVNRARVTSTFDNGERAPGSATGYAASDTAASTVARAGLEVQKTTPRRVADIGASGGAIPWRIRVLNAGETALPSTEVLDTLPTPLSYVPGTATSSCAGFAETAVDTVATATEIRWSVDLAPGADCYIDIDTTHPGSQPQGALVVNDASVDNWRTAAVAEQAYMDLYSVAALGDRVWLDSNGNGIQDPGETGIAGVGVRLVGTDRWGSPVEMSTTTNPEGIWNLDVSPGTYLATFTGLPDGLVFTTQGVGGDALDSDVDPATGTTASLVITSGMTRMDIDSGATSVSSTGGEDPPPGTDPPDSGNPPSAGHPNQQSRGGEPPSNATPPTASSQGAPPENPGTSTPLAFTGGEALRLALFAAGLLTAGLYLTLRNRKRRFGSDVA